MRAIPYNLVSDDYGRMIRMNSVRAKLFIKDKICLHSVGIKQEL